MEERGGLENGPAEFCLEPFPKHPRRNDLKAVVAEEQPYHPHNEPTHF
jgi:hypothetical protein